MKRLASAIFLGMLALSPASGEASGDDDPVARYLFPPEKVLGAARELGLDDAQKKTIRAEIVKSQSKFLDLQLDMQENAERLSALLQEKPVDETKVLNELDKILSTEKEMKRVQLSLLIRIKNALTAPQQAKLSEIQKRDGK